MYISNRLHQLPRWVRKEIDCTNLDFEQNIRIKRVEYSARFFY
jgi:hypothetical protein